MVDREEYSYCGQLSRSAGMVYTAWGLMTCIPERIYAAHSQHFLSHYFVILCHVSERNILANSWGGGDALILHSVGGTQPNASHRTVYP